MHRSLSVVVSLLAVSLTSACASSLPRTITLRPHEGGLSLPLRGLSSAAGRVCALGAGATLECTGADSDTTRVFEVPGTEGALEVSISGARGCVLFTDATVGCFGFVGSEITPVERVEGLTEIVELSVDDTIVCGRRESGSVRCANDVEGMFVVEGVSDAVQIALSAERGCARTSRGEAACWTSHVSAVTDASAPVRHVAVPVPLLDGVISIGGGAAGSFAITEDGGLHLLDDWGGASIVSATELATAAGARSVHVGEDNACVQTEAGGIACWYAFPRRGELRAIDTLASTHDLVVGDRFACAVTHEGALRCAELPPAQPASSVGDLALR